MSENSKFSLRFLKAVERLPPAYFAMIMATGIISIAAFQQGYDIFSRSLFYLNIGLYLGLWVMTLCRILLYRNAFYADFSDHNLGPGFFTLVAGTGVLGSQIALRVKDSPLPLYFWFFTLLLWFIIIYGIFCVLSVKKTKPAIDKGLNGSWLVAVVATQSVSILGTLCVTPSFSHQRPMLLFCLGFWLFGGMLYIWIISLIFYRYMFFPFAASDLTPPYWINMGAAAISTLAGANLLGHAESADFLLRLRPFIEGFTLLFWASATWWIPMLILLGFWRHYSNKIPLQYSPLYWGAVFPLGMYTACTFRLAQTAPLPELAWIPGVFIWIAITAWIVVFSGFIRSLLPKKNQSDYYGF